MKSDISLVISGVVQSPNHWTPTISGRETEFVNKNYSLPFLECPIGEFVGILLSAVTGILIQIGLYGRISVFYSWIIKFF